MPESSKPGVPSKWNVAAFAAGAEKDASDKETKKPKHTNCRTEHVHNQPESRRKFTKY
jgi:hypothetical protein